MRALPRLKALLKWCLFTCGMLLSVATNLADDAQPEPVAPNTSCTNDEGCATTDETPYCLENYSVCVQCQEDDHCAEQQRCFENACVDRCESSDACPDGLVCTEGVCKGCEVDTDCPSADQYCYQGPDYTACRPVCARSLECEGPGYSDGDVCRGGRCQSVGCASDLDCTLDREFCDTQRGLCASIQ